MNLNRKNIRKIRGLIIFAAAVCLALMKFDLLCTAAAFLIGIVKPFLIGGMIAFVINIPMSFFERTIFREKNIPEEASSSKNTSGNTARKTGGWRRKVFGFLRKGKRGLSLVMAYLAVILVIVLVAVTVIPQLVAAIKVLTDKIPVFWTNLLAELEVLFAQYPELLEVLGYFENLQINWQSVINTVVDFLRNGMGSMLSSTFTVASSIVSSTVNLVISLIFSIYILVQKEKLGNQFERLLQAYTVPKVYKWVMKVCGLLHHNFSKFITGQCTEAVILGLLFVITMTIFRFDYAIMVGVLIAFTALIPIVGAFIGCFIGAFLMLVDDPVRALWFVVLFIILQQIEGNLIYPHVVGNSVGLPSIWVLAAVTIGGSLMGIFGMLVFIPLLSTVYMLLREDVSRRTATDFHRDCKQQSS